MSAIIPGSGKIYTGQYGDGITAFLVTGALVYLSWANFDAHHQFRGWLFSGLAAMFYGGNIYGSAASAQLFNAGVKISLDNELKAYLDDHNYFMPEYNFCR
jgi:TM2 domain-containing membrane protein YozV